MKPTGLVTLGWLFLVVAAVAAAEALTPVLPPVRHPGGGQVIYFLLTDRFANGSTANDRGGSAGGSASEHGFDPTRIQFYHGGDFAGLTGKLDYLKRLGVTGIWITPPFVNKPVQGGFGSGSAGYHGYWITDFLNVDPHLGTFDELREFVDAAHALGIRVYCDIVVNHTADVIVPSGGGGYVSKFSFRYRDADGSVFDDREFAANGIVNPAFPALSAVTSFPRAPVVTSGEPPKNPAWLNDLTNYHNRGDSSFSGEDYNYGDIAGLDDLFTEKAGVLDGFVEVYRHWVESVGFDGFRIDTVKHVNPEFWQGFSPAIKRIAREAGIEDFLQFGEVFNGDPRYLSQWTTAAAIDTVLDFGLVFQMREYVSRGRSSDALYSLFDQDDLYTDHDSNASALVTFLGNHDIGRIGFFLREDNALAPDGRLLDLAELGYGLLFTVRGQPCVYYGDEQGMIGTGGDTGAREDMFATAASGYRDLRRIGTSARGDVDKYDEAHPLYQMIARLAELRRSHAALREGAMWPRPAGDERVFAFSRIDRDERREYLVVANNSRTASVTVAVPTSQTPGGRLVRIFDSEAPATPGDEEVVADSEGRVTVQLGPLQFGVWRALEPLGAGVVINTLQVSVPSASGGVITVWRETTEGQSFPSRAEVRAELLPQPDYAEVTFALERADRPGQFEILGVDDAPPYRVYWRPPADLEPGQSFRIVATATDRRGHHAVGAAEGLSYARSGTVEVGVKGSAMPSFTVVPMDVSVEAGTSVRLSAAAQGVPEPVLDWVRDSGESAGAGAWIKLREPDEGEGGAFTARARSFVGTVTHAPALVEVAPRRLPLIVTPPENRQAPVGGNVVLSVEVSGDGPFSYQWTHDGEAIAGADEPSLALSGVGPEDAGRYAVRVSNAAGTVESRPAWLLVGTAEEGRLVNLSVRSRAGVGDETLIAGFVVDNPGGGATGALVRGVGPTLEAYGVAGALADPELVLFGPDGGEVAANDNWGGSDALVATFGRVGAFELAAPTSLDAALSTGLSGGAYTLHVRGRDGAVGVALAEVYRDAASGDSGRLLNLSTRSFVGRADEKLIVGFAVDGTVPKRILVRGIGPTLAMFGVTGVLPDPKVKLFRDGEDDVIAVNDDWAGDPALEGAFGEVGAFVLDAGSLDAALVETLAPGSYSVHLEGFGGDTGIGLVEVYELP